MMEKIRRLAPADESIHLQFVSSMSFLAGRALFRTPGLVLVDVNSDTPAFRSSLKEFVRHHPSLPVIAVTTSPQHGAAVDLVKLGATAYLAYPAEINKISQQISGLHNDWLGQQKKKNYVALQQETYDFRHIIGRSATLTTAIERARAIVKNNTMTVLITGETGTGKELFARGIHFNGRNKEAPFVDIACSALPETLLESELFGYEKGAFTDAKDRKIGLFELAGNGTIFLDEIGDISLSTQSKLLKVIEDRTMRRLGGIRDVRVRARIIAATSVDLDGKMRRGEFRKDLYHRLKILPLELPPLRDRLDDIPLLIDEFLKTYNAAYGKHIKGITGEAIRILMNHEWEGNVRELRHTIERAVLLEESDWISQQDFELKPGGKRQPGEKTSDAAPESRSRREADRIILMFSLKEATIENAQRILALKVLEEVGGNKLKAARILGISRPRLNRILARQ